MSPLSRRERVRVRAVCGSSRVPRPREAWCLSFPCWQEHWPAARAAPHRRSRRAFSTTNHQSLARRLFFSIRKTCYNASFAVPGTGGKVEQSWRTPAHDPAAVYCQVAARQPLRAERLPAAFSRPLRTLGPAEAGRGRPRGHLVHLRERRAENRRRQGLGRRLDARPLRLGIQGEAQGPQGSLLATAFVPRGPGKPAAVGRLRHGPLRGPHQLHQHGQAGPCLRPGRAGRAGQPRHAPQASSPSPRRCGPALPARRSPSRRPSASPSWPTGCAARGSSRCGPPTS